MLLHLSCEHYWFPQQDEEVQGLFSRTAATDQAGDEESGCGGGLFVVNLFLSSVSAPRARSIVTRLNSSQVLVYLQLYRNISVVFLESWQDVTDHVCAITRALAKRPFKCVPSCGVNVS